MTTQSTIFDFINETETKDAGRKPFSFISLFAGIGGFDQGLKNLGGECVFASEIDKYATQAYAAIHGGEVLHGDVMAINAEDVPDHDVLTAGFPCQSFSIAGNRGGFEDARGTLFFEVARIAAHKQPKVMILENVKGLIGHDGGKTLDTILKTLAEIGYRVDFEVLNSKYFGVPQNRERLFIIAIREDLVENEAWNSTVGTTVVPKGKRRNLEYDYIKTFNFDFPKSDLVQYRLLDFLDEEVDERFYINETKTKELIEQIEVGKAIKAGGVNKVAGMYGKKQAGSVYDPQGVSATLDTAGGGYREPIVTVAMNRHKIGREVEVSHCLMARDYKGLGNQEMTGVIEKPDRIRRLTPKECYRLQGFTDEAHDAVEAIGISVSQRYKQAGNAVTVNVIEALGERILPYL